MRLFSFISTPTHTYSNNSKGLILLGTDLKLPVKGELEQMYQKFAAVGNVG